MKAVLITIACIVIILSWFFSVNGYLLLPYMNKILTIPNSPVYFSTDLPWCRQLRENTEKIRLEYLEYTKQHSLRRFRDVDQEQTPYDTSEIPWQVLFLRVYNKNTNKISQFPHTYQCISQIPGCTLAMFSVLPPGKKIPLHTGPYKGVLRYHLALITPKNEQECWISVNDQTYCWKAGQDVLFDDTYPHQVHNNTNEFRVILFLDIQRQFDSFFQSMMNQLFLFLAPLNPVVKQIVYESNQ